MPDTPLRSVWPLDAATPRGSLSVTASFLAGPAGAGGYDNTGLGSLRIDHLALT